MATVTVYGPTINHWRSWLSYELSDGPDYIDVTVRAGPEAVGWGFNINSLTTYVKCTQWRNEVSYTGSFYSPTGGNGWNTHINQTWRILKDHDTWHPTISFRCVNSSGYMNGTSSSSTTFTMGPKTSYTVSYNANGGSGAPGNQTKWYGETLSLSTVRPTRANYTFLGWSTSANGSVAYQPGANYTTNGGATLYAVWKLAHIPPTLTNFKAHRCTSSGTISDNGTYIKVTANYKADTTTNASNKITSAVVGWGSSSSSSNPNAASGTFTQIVGSNGINTANSYTVSLTIKDLNGQSATQSTVVGAAFALMDVDGANKGIAFGRVCPGAGVYIDTTGKIDFNGLTLSNGKSNMADQIRKAIGLPWIKTWTVILNVQNGNGEFSLSQIGATVGTNLKRAINMNTDSMYAVNGDIQAQNIGIYRCVLSNTHVYLHWDGIPHGNTRVNFTVIQPGV